MAAFIFESGATIKDPSTKKAIRSQAMRNVRERQRKERFRDGLTFPGRKKPRDVRGTFSAARPLLPAIARSERNSYFESTEPQGLQLQDFVQAIDSAQIDSDDSTGTDVALTQCADFTNHHVWRQQLGYVFLTSYYADSVVDAMLKDWHNFEPGDAAGATLNASRDALCLMGLGAQYRDENLLDEGRKRHCLGLRLLRERIEGPGGVVCDGLLDACYTLAHCQIYQTVSHPGKGWQIHVEGLHFLLRRRGVESIRSPFAHATLHKIRQIATMDQLLKRKSSFLSSPEWLMSWRQNDPSIHTPALQLTDLGLQLSGALEDTDVALQASTTGKPASGDQVRDVSLRVQSIEHELNQWLLNFYHQCGDVQEPYTLTDIAEYPYFEVQCNDMALLFPKVYSFPTLLSATTHCYLFILYLDIRMAQMDLAELHPTQPATDIEALAAQANEYALHLCRSLAYLSLPQHRSVGVLACSGPLYWASVWYERSGDSKKLQACQSAREVLERDCPTPLNMKAPVFAWWMIPSVFEDQGGVAV